MLLLGTASWAYPVHSPQVLLLPNAQAECAAVWHSLCRGEEILPRGVVGGVEVAIVSDRLLYACLGDGCQVAAFSRHCVGALVEGGYGSGVVVPAAGLCSTRRGGLRK